MHGSEQSTLAILAVEDDPGVAELLVHLLSDVDGWSATVAHDAAAARSTFLQVQIDVLVLDVGLPGIPGLELLELLPQEDGWRDQPVIVVSAQSRQPEVREAIRVGRVTEALMKPFDVDRLVSIIQRTIALETLKGTAGACPSRWSRCGKQGRASSLRVPDPPARHSLPSRGCVA
jgi:CheY-like chemotaxis protein